MFLQGGIVFPEDDPIIISQPSDPMQEPSRSSEAPDWTMFSLVAVIAVLSAILWAMVPNILILAFALIMMVWLAFVSLPILRAERPVAPMYIDEYSPDGGVRVNQVLPSPISPSEYARKVLPPGETVYVETRKHPVSIVMGLIRQVRSYPGKVQLAVLGSFVFVLFGIANGNMTVVSLSLVIYGLFVFMQAARWHLERYIITDQRFVLITGVIKRRTAQLPFARVTDSGTEEPALGRLLRYGTLSLEGAGEADPQFKGLVYMPQISALRWLVNRLCSSNQQNEDV